MNPRDVQRDNALQRTATSSPASPGKKRALRQPVTDQYKSEQCRRLGAPAAVGAVIGLLIFKDEALPQLAMCLLSNKP